MDDVTGSVQQRRLRYKRQWDMARRGCISGWRTDIS
jgi:hypothetical protein